MIENKNIIEIENEYRKINNKWLRLHFKTAIYLVIFSLAMECIFGWILYKIGEIHIEISLYIIKYFVIPFTLNMFFVFITYCIFKSPRCNQNFKMYVVSLLYVAVCFILFSVHCIFSSLYLIFSVPILFTIVYGDYLLTTVTAICSISAEIISQLFMKWDPEKLDLTDNNVNLSNFMISLVILSAFYVVCLIVIHFERQKNAASIQKELERYQLQQKLHHDELTSINNRTALRNAFKRMEEDTTRCNYIFVMIDIDNFKVLNDTLGHARGDLFLSQFGNILKLNCLEATPFRFGGDEFCILFNNVDKRVVLRTCERIKREFNEFVSQNNIDLPLSVSFGIAQFSQGMDSMELLKNADSALYQSKTVKNAISIYEEEILESRYQEKING